MLSSSSVLAKAAKMLLISDSSPKSSYTFILIQAPCAFITLPKSFSMALARDRNRTDQVSGGAGGFVLPDVPVYVKTSATL